MSSRRLYVGHLSNDAREDDVRDLFEKYGKVYDVELKNGHGFVEFEDRRDAEDAAYYLDGKRFFGERLVVEPDRYSDKRRNDYRLYIENVSPCYDWYDIKDIFKRAGTITYGDLDTRTGEGVIEFKHYDDMEYALKKFDGMKFDGYRLRVYESSRNKRRSPSRSPSPRVRSRSRSRSRSRTPSRSRSRSRLATPVNENKEKEKETKAETEEKRLGSVVSGTDSAVESSPTRKDKQTVATGTEVQASA
eukprot:comp41453_c0_seq1/m.47436 comp41453_c0_seq1/g.47436  ORF comp41453_c0_seq1/g.47436 comp41453_c0_seq1/m.47436 type:complete len:247 (-) comp41453_c0_seq1:562-1302(-)